jgi:hypothetical protein
VVLEEAASSLQSCLTTTLFQTHRSPDATTTPEQRWEESEEKPHRTARDPSPTPS